MKVGTATVAQETQEYGVEYTISLKVYDGLYIDAKAGASREELEAIARAAIEEEYSISCDIDEITIDRIVEDPFSDEGVKVDRGTAL